MGDRWYKESVIYSLDVDTFQDSDGDGHGDLRGLIGRLDYLARLGVTCLWLNPIHPTPNRDDGYDVTDYYGVDPRLGSPGDFAELAQQSHERGLRIILDLVVNHTSDQHPWFRSACADPDSLYRDWYVWSKTEPPDRRQGMVFPGEQSETWTWQEQARAWYYHRFYDFQPDLNWSNPAVREEIRKVMGFWLQLGASGFRIDAAPFVLEQVGAGVEPPPKDFTILDNWRQEMQWRKGDAVLLCEANVEPDQVTRYCTGTPDGPSTRAHMLFNFLLNPRLWLALARCDAEPIIESLREAPKLPTASTWVTFLRNHDELDLSRLTKDQQAEVFRTFAPRTDMRLYDRGIRRRVAPMLRGDERRTRLAYSLQFTMPGTPALRYGGEIGMGENLSLRGRDAFRTPMQWDDSRGGGFSRATPDEFVRPVIARGGFGVRKVNVLDQERDPESLLSWFERMIRTLRECPEVGVGTCTVVDRELPRPVLAHRMDAPEGSMLFLHNLADAPVTVDLDGVPDDGERPTQVFADTVYPEIGASLGRLALAGWGYRWIRLRGAFAE